MASSPLSQKLRELADQLRKEAANLALPKPLPNPIASNAKGDLGSLKPKSPAANAVPVAGGFHA